MKNNTDVIVIGAGPSGLLLSNLLARQGVRVTLIEQLPQLIDYPRAVGIDDESMRSMQAAGLANEVAAHISPQHAIRVLNGKGTVISEMAPTTEVFGWARRNGFIQPLVDEVLFKGLDRFEGVEVLFGHEVTDLTEGPDGIAVSVTVLESGEEITLTADYVVGCEGGRSKTRKWIGAEFEGVSTGTRWLVVDVENDPLGTPNAIFGADPKRPHGSFGLPHGVRRWEFLLHDDEPDALVNSDDFIHGLLAEHTPNPAGVDISRRRVFTHNARVASVFRKGRVLIAGDAAHLMPTWAGQGWNSCIRDSTNLAWKLAAVVHGNASNALLDTYDAERRAHAKAMVALSLNMGKVFGTTNKFVGGLRDKVFLGLNVLPKTKSYVTGMGWKPMPRYDKGVVVDAISRQPGFSDGKLSTKRSRSLVAKVDGSGVGVQFPQPWVSTAEHARIRMDDVIGTGWNVLVWGNDPATLFSEAALANLEQLGAQLVRIVPEVRREWTEANTTGSARVLGDVDGKLKEWFDDRPFSVVFLRPDKFVGAVSLTGDAEGTLGAVLEAMSFRKRHNAAV